VWLVDGVAAAVVWLPLLLVARLPRAPVAPRRCLGLALLAALLR
jgi:hypothetical protein